MGAQLFNEVIMDPDLLAFIAMALDSEDIHLRYAHNWGAHSHKFPAPLGATHKLLLLLRAVRFPGNDPQGVESETEVKKYGGGTTKQRFGGFHASLHHIGLNILCCDANF